VRDLKPRKNRNFFASQAESSI
jgi:hypothetical protein